MPHFSGDGRMPGHDLLNRRRRLPGRRPLATTAVALLAVVGAALTTSPASSASSSSCPAPYPVNEVTRGQDVHGLTVHEGTRPDRFTGEVLGVVRDGIAPGLDMVMARLQSPEIDRVGGIWQGMSGSPVYAADGRLLGAVAYSLAMGPSPVAGITPADEMYRMLGDEAPLARAVRPREEVRLPSAMERSLADSGVAARSAASAGMVRLPVPFAVSGMVSSERLRTARKTLGLRGTAVHAGGSVATDDAAIPVVAGGNMAASMSYGDVSTVGVGTATAVCGGEVVGFGHPMSFTGPSRMTLHGADAVLVQDDPAGAPFKLANAGSPVGAVEQDRLSGLRGRQEEGAVPSTAEVTSYVEVPGGRARTGTTRISVPEAVPDIAALHLLADQDRIFDGMGGGSARVDWTVTGTREDGRRFRLERRDRFASRTDLSSEPVFDLLDQLSTLSLTESEQVTITRVHTASRMTRDFRAYTVAKVQVRTRGRWRAVRPHRPLLLRAGTTRRFRVLLTSRQLPSARVVVPLTVPQRIGRKSGVLEIMGGNTLLPGMGGLGEAGLLEPTGPSTFGAVLHRLRRTPRNDQVLASLSVFRNDGSTLTRSGRRVARAVVDGGLTVPVQGLP